MTDISITPTFTGTDTSNNGGTGHIYGNTRVGPVCAGATPAAARIRLFDRRTGVLVREVWSNPNNIPDYDIKYLTTAEDHWMVVAEGDDSTYIDLRAKWTAEEM